MKKYSLVSPLWLSHVTSFLLILGSLWSQGPGDRLKKFLQNPPRRPLSSENRGGAPNETCSQAWPVALGVNYADGPSTGGGCYYCDGATNADWYYYVPSAPGIVHVKTCGSDVDTRLWVYRSASDCSTLELIGGFDDECPLNNAPGADLYATEGYFQVCPGNTYYLEWDDMWDSNPFAFTFEFYPNVGTDLAVVQGVASEYSHMPPQGSGIRGYLTCLNIGINPLTDVKLRTRVQQGPATLLNAIENAAPLIPVCADPQNYFSGPHPFSTQGNYQVTLSLEVNETETDPDNNALVQSLRVDTVFARDEAPYFDFPVGGAAVLVGQNFALSAPGILTGVAFRFGPGMFANPIPLGFRTRLYVYNVQAGSSKPMAALDSTEDYFIGMEDTGWVTLPLRHGPLALPAGGFFVGFRHFNEFQVADLVWAGSLNRYFPGKNLWLKLDGVPDFWSMDSLFIGNQFENGFALALRAHFGVLNTNLEGEQASKALEVFPNPVSDVLNIKVWPGWVIEEGQIWDALGRCVMTITKPLGNNVFSLPVRSWTPGVFTISVRLSGQSVGSSYCVRRNFVVAQ
ncbi:MAG: T9SS type A sorting domain-containing protein [Flavobacteriales bacterium]|nr:T9SS type A sorting domain-containing protein [Flavobacteriales bacterium]